MKTRLILLGTMLAAFILTGAICDKGGSTGPSVPYDEYVTTNLPGTWQQDWDGEDVDLYATLATAQQTVDNASPGTGGITVSGDVSGTLQYGYFAESGGGDALCVVASVPGTAESFPAMGLAYEKDQGTIDIYLMYFGTGGENDMRQYEFTSGTCTFEGATRTLTVTNLVLTDAQTGNTVTLNGTFVPALKTLAAGVEHNLGETWYDAAPYSITFNSDSTVQVNGQTGIWSVVGNQVMTVIGGDTTYYSIIISGNIMTITVNDDIATAWPYDPDPLGEVEDEYGFETGSVASARVAGTIRYDRQTATAEAAVLADRPVRKKVPGTAGRFIK